MRPQEMLLHCRRCAKAIRRPSRGRRRMLDDQRGAMGVQMALLAVLLLGFVGLGGEVTTLLFIQKKMQNAADSAVIVASTVGLSAANSLAEAQAAAAVNGYVNGSGGVSVTYNSPPLSGTYAGNANAQEVVITKPYVPHLISLYLPGTITIKARAAALTSGKTPGCLLALATSGTAITLSGGAKVVNSSCQVMANSTSATSLVMASGTSIAGAVGLVGGASLSGSATIGGPLQAHGKATSDPYASVVLPTPGTCLSGIPTQYSGTNTINPGHYCNGIKFANNAIITFNPGVYFVDSNFSAGNNDVLKATGTSGIGGVTIILNSFSQALSSSNFSIGNNASWSISAPTSGATAGMAFVAQPSLTGSFQLNNNTQMTVVGVMYMPKINITFQGTSNTTSTSCTQLIANTINISTTVNFQGQCSNTAIKRIGSAGVNLVE